jgi:hypothetical protein
VIASRPTAASPVLIFKDPSVAKCAATLAAFWLHQADVYRVANAFIFSVSMGVGLEAHANNTTTAAAAVNDAAMDLRRFG